jgi:tetratricopeptide (TPR) repeat protein
MAMLIAIFVAMPFKSVISHWSDNEQRGHLFGYWFGHDMFTPPFTAPDGKLSYDAKLRAEAMKGTNASLVYPEMARDAILFGGTDPGRFCPTYMIFCESFVPARCKPNDPVFDRRDVYIITQNALADQTYLEYIRAQYNRSTQIDAPFFQEMLRTKADGLKGTTNPVAGLAYRLLDQPLARFGAGIENRRRKEGVYPPKEIHTPSNEDHQRVFNEYMADASRRLQMNQLKPNEDVKIDTNSGRMAISGQVAVMTINGLLTKVIFDQNPNNEFYVEESFPLDWMYDHLEPYGIIMKINRKPLAEIDQATVTRDHEFWSRYSDRLIGNWITYDTPVKDICDFVVRVYERRDYNGFKGDPKFVRDDQAQKSFSKLRSSIGGIYSWRLARARTAPEQQRMLKEADFAFRQAFAFCPYSPEAVFRYVSLLASYGRFEDAVLITETCLRFDPDNPNIKYWVNQMKTYKEQQGQFSQSQGKLLQMERQLQTNPGDARLAFDVASAYLQIQNTSAAFAVLDRLAEEPKVEAGTLLSVANVYVQFMEGARLETVLKKLVTITPDSPEAWFDLATTQAQLGRGAAVFESLQKAIELSDARLKKVPASADLRINLATNLALAPVRNLPEFQKLKALPQ